MIDIIIKESDPWYAVAIPRLLFGNWLKTNRFIHITAPIKNELIDNIREYLCHSVWKATTLQWKSPKSINSCVMNKKAVYIPTNLYPIYFNGSNIVCIEKKTTLSSVEGNLLPNHSCSRRRCSYALAGVGNLRYESPNGYLIALFLLEVSSKKQEQIWTLA